MQIFVRTITGKSVTIEVEFSDTVDSLKAKFEELTGIPFEQQRLIFSGRLLEDGHKLSDYNLVEFCTLQLILRSLRCPVCTLSRYGSVRLNLSAGLKPESTIFFSHNKNSRSRLIYRLIHQPNTPCIYVQTRTLIISKTIALQVDPSDTICDVRKKIGGHQNLFLAAGNKLNDDRTFGYYYHEIQNDSTLYLDFSIMQIFVKMRNGKTITLEAEPSDKIGDVKAKIRDQQRIIFDGNELSDQHRKLGSYNIHNDSTLHLDLCRPHGGSMQIAVKTLAGSVNSEAIRFKVKVTDKIGDVKAKIQDQQRLLFNGQQLVDGQTLADYGIQNESTLHLHCPMHVSVKTFAGQTITLEVDPSNTIGDVKEMIGDHQSLTFDGNELDDGKTLAEYNVHMGSTLHLDA